MKRFLIFIVSFTLIYLLLQILSGFILTVMYSPPIENAKSSITSEVTFGRASYIPFLIGLVASTTAYMASKKIEKSE
ncbi:hypothetical protein H1D32_05845 [Anaerobacillus sp. CMMVII]|uniref:hypothetical protein n=1 Tax=Anaerobacillus sp. CMMVII TaxID=2755588 RepID=UPI0021B6F9ED|nr:hypothetical protein [Anaerobacillus sp. CMMVII]MCT8137307.1 hypothetical protein [Anaerobacillus sp. CMMVII]